MYLESSSSAIGEDEKTFRFSTFQVHDDAVQVHLADIRSLSVTKAVSAESDSTTLTIDSPTLTFMFGTYAFAREAMEKLKLPPAQSSSETNAQQETQAQVPRNLAMVVTRATVAIAHDTPRCAFNRVALTCESVRIRREETVEDGNDGSDSGEFVDALEEEDASTGEDTDFFDAVAGTVSIQRSEIELNNLLCYTAGAMGDHLLCQLSLSVSAVEDPCHATRVLLHLPLVLVALSQRQFSFLAMLPVGELSSTSSTNSGVQENAKDASPPVQPCIEIDDLCIGLTKNTSPTTAEVALEGMKEWVKSIADLGFSLQGLRFSTSPGSVSFVTRDIGVFVDGNPALDGSKVKPVVNCAARWSAGDVDMVLTLNVSTVKLMDVFTAFKRFDFAIPNIPQPPEENKLEVSNHKDLKPASWGWLRIESLDVSVTCDPVVILLTPCSASHWLCLSWTLPQRMLWKEEEHLFLRVKGVRIFSCSSPTDSDIRAIHDESSVLLPLEIEATAYVNEEESLIVGVNLSKLHIVVDWAVLGILDTVQESLEAETTAKVEADHVRNQQEPIVQHAVPARGNFFGKVSLPLLKVVLREETPIVELILDGIETAISELGQNDGRQDLTVSLTLRVHVWNNELFHWVRPST